MNSLTLGLVLAASISLALAALGGLVLVVETYRKLTRLVEDTRSLQRMITAHGDNQLSADGRFAKIEHQLSTLQERDLQVQSIAAGFRSVESAGSLIDNTGVTDAERLAFQSGLTEREASLMLQLRSAYSTDTTSLPDGAK